MTSARCMASQAGGPTLVRSYEVEERTESAYAQIDMQFGEKLQAQVGVRYSKLTTPMEFTDLVSPDPDEEQHEQ